MRIGKKNFKLRSSVGLSIKPGIKQVAIITSLLTTVVILGWFTFLNFSKQDAYGAVTGDYRTSMSGNWNLITTWQRYNGSSWVAAIATPNSADGVITIQNGHTVTVTANATVDQVVISSGGQMVLNTGVTLTLANGTGTDLDVSGVFKNAGTVTISGAAAIAYQSGGKYQHNYTTAAGTIPTASWNTLSTCEIIGYTTNAAKPWGLSQSFGNFTWNCALQSQDIDLAGGLTSITGNFTVANTGIKSIIMASGGSTLAIARDYIQTGGICTLASNSSASSTFNIAGSYNQSGGTFTVVTGSSGVGTLNVSGNWSHTGGTLTVGGNGSTNAQIKFVNTGSQIFSASSNTVSGNVDFNVNSGSILVMGNNILKGRNFTLASGAELQMGSVDGITNSGSLGNIQVSGTRNFNAAATYTYNGLSAQNTGNGLPATISNLTLNNSNGLTISSTIAVSNILTLTSGKIITGSNELQITNLVASPIAGYSSSNYIIGNLRLTVNGSGTYTYPVGSISNYELLTVKLISTTGFTSLLGSFTNSNPINPSFPLSGVSVGGSSIDSMLNSGYWTLIPNSAITSGTYEVNASETGYTNTIAGKYYYPLLARTNINSSWVTNGNDRAYKYASNTMTARKTAMTFFGDYGIGFGLCPPIFSFDNYTLISGTNNTPGAVYLVSDIAMGLDAWIQITDFVGGATVSDVDNWNGSNGYEDAWQPFVNASANTTSSVGWKTTFKVGGTATDTVLPNVIFAAIDVDGDGSSLKEFVTAYQPNSISYSSSTLLQITNNAGDRTATAGTSTSFPNIDTNNVQAMFKVNYKNVSSFKYRTGVINNGGAQVRQASLYFKSFFSLPVTVLPIKLVSFNAKLNSNNQVDLKWVTESETNNDYFSVERSADGKFFEKVVTQTGAGNSHTTLTYASIDKNPLKGVSYYRLKQTDYNGEFTYSNVITVNNQGQSSSLEIKYITPTVFHESFRINFTGKEKGLVDFMLTNTSGQLVAKDKIQMEQGFNSYEFIDQKNLPKGIYIVTLYYDGRRTTYKVVKQ